MKRVDSSFLAAAAVALLAGCSHGDTAATAAATPPPVPVVVQKVTTADVPLTGQYVARVLAMQTVEVRARVNGTLQAVMFADGSLVRRGQQLFQIQPEEYAAALQSAQAQLAKARADAEKARDNVAQQSAAADVAVRASQLDKANRDVARLEPLAAEKAVTQADLDNALTQRDVASSSLAQSKAALQDTQLAQKTALLQAQAAVSAAQAAVTQAQLNLSYTKIVSPLSGQAGFVKVDVGNVVGPGTTSVLATISAVEPIQVQFGITEDDYLTAEKRLESGTQGTVVPVDLYLGDNVKYPYPGRITALDRAVDPKTGTLNVDATFPNPQGLLRPGLFGRAVITESIQHDAILVPQRAVTPLQDASTVFVVGDGNVVKQRTIMLGNRFNSDYVVTSGLKAGETIVIEGVQKIRSGSTVIPNAPQSAEAAPAR